MKIEIQESLPGFYKRSNDMEKLLIASSLFSVLLVVIKSTMTGYLSYLFLPWNLFLAWIPYLISKQLTVNPHWLFYRWKLLVILVAWLLFIPNSFYILTDLFHLQMRRGPAMWFDLTLIFSFAWNGIMLGILSVRQMEELMMSYFHSKKSWLFVFPVMWLIALGIYIGRYMRFNSWDILTRPFSLLWEIAEMIFNPFHNSYEWAMIACFAIFMTLMYLSVKRMAKVIQ